MKEDMFKQTITAFNESDLTLLMIDAKKGVTEAEKTFVQYLRKYGSKHQVILVVNKCDN
jgi:predicted GTPase